MEARLRVPIIINYYYGVEEMELDSINIDDRLSFSDKCGSVVQISEKEYFDENIDVEHEICPHCGAEMLVHEINPHHVLGHKEKEDVLCPKCHKVVCSSKTNGYFKTELIKN